MFQIKRLTIAMIFGVVSGLICYLGGRYGLKDDISPVMFLYIIVNRTLIGFVIGISVLRVHWALHGGLMGIIVGLPFTVGCLLEEGNVETAIAALLLSAIYGFIIEFFTSAVFGARATISVRGEARAA